MNVNMRTPYRPPEIDRSKVVNKMPEHARGAVLLPTTPVVILNRGPRTLEDKFDGYDYVFEPFGYFEVTYAAALHLQKRLQVPGTRNADVRLASYVSWIGILGIDSDEACQPFTAAQLASLGEAAEAIYRDPSDPLQRGFQTVRTKDIIPTLPGHGLATPAQAMAAGAGYGGGSVAPQQEVVGGSDENREAATARVVDGDARLAEATARQSGYEPPDVTELRVKSDDPIRFRGDAPPDGEGDPVGAAAGAPAAPAIGRKRGAKR